MQSFATQMLFKLFFTDRGMKYLEETVARVIETVMDMREEQLEVLLRHFHFPQIPSRSHVFITLIV